MPFEIVRNDITHIKADAIVNTANPRPTVGSGVDAMIHQKAGPNLLAARQAIGDIAPGCAAITPAYQLNAKYVIHTVGPVWQGGNHNEAFLLRECYDRALELALEYQCRSVAFPLISTGNYGFPKDLALEIAISAFSSFLMDHEMQICLVVFDRDSFRLSERLFQGIAVYIDEHYARKHEHFSCSRPSARRLQDAECYQIDTFNSYAPTVQSKSISLEDILKETDAGFTETLLHRIDESGKKDSEIYKKALLSKQHFSKIRNNPGYKPTKATAIALALALELDLEQTKDLIGRAGYALTNSSKFDLIICYFIERGIYNVVQINIALYEFDQPLLGS